MTKDDEEIFIAAVAVGLEEEHEYAASLLASGKISGDDRHRIVCALFASAYLHDCGHVNCARAQLMSVRYMLHGTPFKSARMVN